MKLELKLHPDYVEFYVVTASGKSNGFNVKYELLPNEFDYRTYRPRDMFIRFPVILMAGQMLFALVSNKASAYATILFAFLFTAILCAIGYGLRLLLKKEITALAIQAGMLLVVKDQNYDQIMNELKVRREAALRALVLINSLQPPWSEVKKFKWLRDEGIISSDEFEFYRARILSSVEVKVEKAIEPLVIH